MTVHDVPFRWPSWAPKKGSFDNLLPLIDDSSELKLGEDVVKRDAIEEAFAVSKMILDR
jgi:hypothetical protein